MTVRIAVASVRGGVGVTTTSLLLARSLDNALLVEADLHGGTIAPSFELGRSPGLTTFASNEASPSLWREHAQSAGGVSVLVGPDSPTAAHTLWRNARDRIERNLALADVDAVVLDAGRVSPLTSTHVRSDLVLLLVRPVVEHLVTLSHLLPQLLDQGARVALAGVGDGPYDLHQTDLGVDSIGHLPHDPATAAALLGGYDARAAVRSQLARSIVGLADSAARAARVHQAFAGSDAS